MRCKKIISYLNAYVDGELPKRMRCIVESHLMACESCRGRVEDIRRMDELFQGTLPVPPVPDGLAARIMAEARRRQTACAPKRSLAPLEWSPFRWIAELSTPMRLAACVTVLLAFVVGLSLDGRDVTRRNVLIEQGKDLYGLEWFAPAPPGSIGSIYIAMAYQPYEKGSGQ